MGLLRFIMKLKGISDNRILKVVRMPVWHNSVKGACTLALWEELGTMIARDHPDLRLLLKMTTACVLFLPVWIVTLLVLSLLLGSWPCKSLCSSLWWSKGTFTMSELEHFTHRGQVNFLLNSWILTSGLLFQPHRLLLTGYSGPFY